MVRILDRVRPRRFAGRGLHHGCNSMRVGDRRRLSWRRWGGRHGGPAVELPGPASGGAARAPGRAAAGGSGAATQWGIPGVDAASRHVRAGPVAGRFGKARIRLDISRDPALDGEPNRLGQIDLAASLGALGSTVKGRGIKGFRDGLGSRQSAVGSRQSAACGPRPWRATRARPAGPRGHDRRPGAGVSAHACPGPGALPAEAHTVVVDPRTPRESGGTPSPRSPPPRSSPAVGCVLGLRPSDAASYLRAGASSPLL
jgi:hypothetical protein